MKTIYHTVTFILFFLMLFPLNLSARDYSNNKDEIEYETLEYKSFNESLLSGSIDQEDWLSDPVTVSLKFVGPFEGRTQTIERINESAESSDKTKIVITNQGLLDDSVMGVKYKLALKKTDNVWIVESAGKVVKCWPGRGHQQYSAEPCS